MDADRVGILYDHYKDTFTQIRSYSDQRDRMFLAVLVGLVVLAVEGWSPTEAQAAAVEFVKAQSGMQVSPLPAAVGVVVRFSVLALLTRYFQLTITVARQYPVLHAIEKRLSDAFGKGEPAFTREGLAYARGFPTFSRWLHSFYLYVFPTFVALMSSWRIYADLPWSGSDGALRLLGLSASLLTLVVVAVYWYSRGREEID